jgi:DEAD/DEAH box helicase domain-containing protein
MIPSLVAREVKDAILDYLETTFAFAEPPLWEALKGFLLDPKAGLFKGPYVQLRLPFRKAEAAAEAATGLEIRPSWRAYAHQAAAWARLAARQAGGPRPTLVTTGTGSGKTECFLYPLLDHVVRTPGPGVKALVLYPMNALSSDQARRFAEVIAQDERLKGRATVGLYIGENGTHGTMGPDYVVDRREDLRAHPPDILLTNYKMLDYLLLRPEDRRIWDAGERGTLRYVVLDELHTYDGAQGSDVACLLRRLYARLGVRPGEITPVGTSATLGAGGEASERLREFAEKIFGTPFGADAVIGENRLTSEEKLLATETDDIPPPATRYEPAAHEDADAYLARMKQEFFGVGGLTPEALGRRILSHGLTRQILEVASTAPAALLDVAKHVQRRYPELRSRDVAEVERLVEAFLALVAAARDEGGGKRPPPLLTLQVQFWVREIKRLLRVVAPDYRFRWADDGEPAEHGEVALPMVVCGDCGETGWVTLTDSAGKGYFRLDPNEITRAWGAEDQYLRYIFPKPAEDGPIAAQGLRISGGKLVISPVCEVGDQPVLIDATTTKPERGIPKTLRHCPKCDTNDALWMVGSQAASLGSVTVSHLFLSHFNEDKKLLAFTDSVQDASHRSGFFAARTYRFTLRTALQTLVQEKAGAITLDRLGRELLPYWERRFADEAQDRLTALATFLPPDLVDYRPIVDALETDADPATVAAARELLIERLAFETNQEFGIEARPGRTLALTGCSVAVPRFASLRAAAERLALVDSEQNRRIVPPSARDYETFLWGLLTRLERRGAIWHPTLRAFVEHDGDRKMLTLPFRKPPLLPSFYLKGVPGFLTDRTAKDTGFESWQNPKGWHRRWTRRTLAIEGEEVDGLYLAALRALVGEGILQEHETASGAKAWCLDPAALEIASEVRRLSCNTCGDVIAAARAEASAMTSAPCVRGWCRGRLGPSPEKKFDYYRALYTSGRIHRIFPHEHTGLLKRRTREEVETLFKAERQKPGAPNLLTCTPTLEMGVDIGDLSATLACSVPPTTSSHLQRAGRAGRSTGNALVLILANAQPHDLYHFAEPMDLLAGAVEPPGCHLDAVEMLKRQFVAFTLDRLTQELPAEAAYPRNARALLAADERGEFPATLVDALRVRGAETLRAFEAVFGGALQAETLQRLRKAVLDGSLANRVRTALDRERKTITELGRRLRLLRDREKVLLEEGPQKHADFKTLTQDFTDEIRGLLSEIRDRGDTYFLNWFTDAGLLPNYAFPEEGVILRSMLRGVKARDDDDVTKGGFVVREYPRSAGSALREFAPFNTFYAEARKVVINQVETGGKAEKRFEAWRFCESCAFMAKDEHPTQKSCPQCGALGFDDVGRVRDVLKLTKVFARANAGESLSLDRSENRERTQYETKTFFEIPADARKGGWVARDVPFGFEAFDRMILREVNFGERSDTPGNHFRVGDREVPEDGFELCEDCGVVRGHGAAPRHAPYCTARDKGKEKFRKTALYREMESEALRLLVPAATLDLDDRKASFRAAVKFGLRLRFGGRPLHLQIETMDEPAAAGSDLRRQYLVLYDTVPGGTGYLRGFVDAADPLKGVLEILARAREGIRRCRCRREARSDGCYACVFGYEDRFSRPHVKATLALEMLDEILGVERAWERVGTLGDVEIVDKAESDLERRFLAELGEKRDGVEFVRDTAGGPHTLIVDGLRYAVTQQESLGAAAGVAEWSRPDFTIRPARPTPGVDAIHVFCDGFESHVAPQKPRCELPGDVAKREAIRAVPGLVPWTVTWFDLDDFHENRKGRRDDWFTDRLPSIAGMARPAAPPAIMQALAADAMTRLLAFLRRPDPALWRTAAAVHAVDFVLAGPAGSGVSRHRGRTEGPLRLDGSIDADQVKRAAFEAVRLDLRMDEGAVARADADYKNGWRRFLKLWNLFQWLPGLRVSTGETGASSPSVSGTAGGNSAAVGVAAVDGSASPDEPWVGELADRRLASAVRAASTAGYPLPEIGVDLTDAEGRVLGTIELLYRAARTAVLLDAQAVDRSAVESAGFAVLSASDVMENPSCLTDALRAAGRSAS